MSILFNITDKSGRKIRLTKERWQHINQEHPDVNYLEELKETLTNPLKITPSKYDPDTVCYHYRYIKNSRKYLMVAVKYITGDGFIITSYYMRKIQ